MPDLPKICDAKARVSVLLVELLVNGAVIGSWEYQHEADYNATFTISETLKARIKKEDLITVRVTPKVPVKTPYTYCLQNTCHLTVQQERVF